MEDKCRIDIEETIAYYNHNATAFVDLTINADVSDLYKPFEELIPSGARILDLGCGSGRDSRYFAKRGYDVVAVDSSFAMCEYTRSIVDIPVFQMKVEDMSFEMEFDAVWACASLLHVPKAKQKSVLMLIGEALKIGGICYCSWKYGDEERTDNGRFFADYTERSLSDLLNSMGIFKVICCWVTDDVRINNDQKWINVIIRKQ